MPKIRVEADLGNVFSDLDKLAAAAKKLSEGTEKEQKDSLNGVIKEAEKVSRVISQISKTDIAPKNLDNIVNQFEEIGKTVQGVETKLAKSSDFLWSGWMTKLGSRLKKAASDSKEFSKISQESIKNASEFVRTDGRIKAADFFKEYTLVNKGGKLIPERLQQEPKEGLPKMPEEQTVPSAAVGAAGMISRGAGFLGSAGILTAGYTIIQMIQGILASMGNAQDESIAYSDLRQSLGATTTNFEELRDSMRLATDGFGIAYNETAKLADEFVRASGTVRSTGSIARGVQLSAGFARGYGVAPGVATQFFGTAERTGDQSGRRLAVMIGEAVGKGDLSTKMADVLSALTAFMSRTAMQSFTAPGTTEFLSMLSSLTGSGLPGLKGNPMGAVSMLEMADAAIRQGGAFGEASKNFSLALYNKKAPGFDVYDFDVLNSQGSFGTFRKAFGEDSPAFQMAAQRGDAGTMERYKKFAEVGDVPLLTMQMEELGERFGRDTRELANTIKTQFGFANSQQAAAFYNAFSTQEKTGDTLKRLAEAGVDVDTADPRSVSILAGLTQDPKLFDAQKRKLLAMEEIPTKEKIALTTGTQGEMEKAVLKLTSIYDSTADEGKRLRELQIKTSNAMQEIVSKLIPAVITIKDIMVDTFLRPAAKWLGADTTMLESQDFGSIEKVREDLLSLDNNNERIQRLQHRINEVTENPDYYPPEYAGKLENEMEMIRSEAGPYSSGIPLSLKNGMGEDRVKTPERAAVIKDISERHKLPEWVLPFLLNSEKSNATGKGSKSPKGAIGEWQIAPINLRDERNAGLDPRNFAEGGEMAARVVDDARRKYGDNWPAIIAYYNGGKPQGDPVSRGQLPPAEETRKYLKPLLKDKALGRDMDRGAPETQAPKKEVQKSLKVGGVFYLKDQSGRDIAEPIVIPDVGAPIPAGMA